MENELIILQDKITSQVSGLSLSIRDALWEYSNNADACRNLTITAIPTLWLSNVGRNFLIEDDTYISVFIRGISKLIFWSAIGAGIISLSALAFITQYDITLTKKINWLWYKDTLIEIWQHSKHWLLGASIGSAILQFYIKREFEPLISNFLASNSKDTITATTIPSAKNIELFLPKSKFYDPRKFFNKAKKLNSIFIGLDEQNMPIYLPFDQFTVNNMQIIGQPGYGKGVLFSNIVWQLMALNTTCIIFNPKKDSWAPSILKHACNASGKNFTRIDLSALIPSINPILGAIESEIYELFIATFGLNRTGADADHYRNNDRKGAALLSKTVQNNSNLTLKDIFKKTDEILGSYTKECAGLIVQLEELANITATNTHKGFDLMSFIDEGGCLLIEGDTINESTKILMKMILARVIQLAIKRRNKNQHICIIADEVKYLLTKTLIDGAGILRDYRVNLIIAHQALPDLCDSDSALDPETVQNTIIGNTPIKFSYKTDFNTAQWFSNECGTISGYREIVDTYSNAVVSDNLRLEKRFQTEEFPLIHPNIIQNLNLFTGVVLGIRKSAVIAFTSTIPIKKIDVPIYIALPEEVVDEDEGLL